jgi:internalin A
MFKRTTIVMICLLSLTCATHADEAEDKAIKFVKELGGKIQNDDDAPITGPVIEVDLEGRQLTDAGLKKLVVFKQLRSLNIADTKVTDIGLKELATLKQLKKLALGGPGVTDAGMKELATLNQLEDLDLQNTKVTDAGLKELADLKKFKSLRLTGAQVTDAGKKAFKEAHPNCKIYP